VLLAIDAGNTSLSFGLFVGSARPRTFRVDTVPAASAGEYAELLRQRLAQLSVDSANIHAAILGSVVPVLTPVLVEAVHLALGVRTLVVGLDVQVPMRNRYDNPAELGVDRLLNAYAGYQHVNGATVVVDFGTATKLDCVSPTGDYLGGVIAPGFAISLDALATRAAQLKLVPPVAPPHVVARNTIHAVQAGTVLGHAALVDGLLLRIQEELGYPSHVIATGGFAEHIVPHCRTAMTTEPHLTLNGLHGVWQHAQRLTP
jgi:type III pantothenate kinase